MNRLVLIALIAGLSLALSAPTPAGEGDDAALFRKLLAEKAPTVVTVKFVMKIHIQRGAQEADREMEQEITGVLVSPDGLVMMPSALLNPQSSNRGVTVTGQPVDFKILFPGGEEEKEHDAVLAAKDSNLNLAFVAMKDSKARKFRHVDFGTTVDPEVGQELVGVSRLPRGFDFAPYFGTVLVTGKITKPRRMFRVGGTFATQAQILYDRSGVPAGALSAQQGASGRGTGLFLLPGDVVRATIEQASRSAAELLGGAESGATPPEEDGEKRDEDG